MIQHKFNWKSEVIESTEPVLVDFWAAWCGPCKMMNPALESLAKDFRVYKVNVDTNQKLAAAYKIDSIPQLMIFKDGKVMARHVGVVSEKTLRDDLQKFKTVGSQSAGSAK